MPLRIEIVPFTARKTSGIQEITSPNITSAPMAVYTTLLHSPISVVRYVNKFARCYGASDGTRQWSSTGWWTTSSNPATPVISGRNFSDTTILKWFDTTSGILSGSASATGPGAGPISNGWRFFWTFSDTVNDNQTGYAIFICGSGVQAYADTHTISNTVSVGFVPKFIFTNTSDSLVNTIAPGLKSSYGVVSINNPSSIGSHGGGAFAMDNGGPLEGVTLFDDKIPAGGISTDFNYTYDHFTTPNNLTIISSGRSNKAVGFLALNWTGSQTSTVFGVNSFNVFPSGVLTTDVGFKPQVIGYITSNLTAYGNSQAPNTNNSAFPMIGVSGGTSGNSFSDSVSNIGGLNHLIDNKVMNYYATPVYYTLSYPNFTQTGWEFTPGRQISVSTVDWKWIAWAIQEATPTTTRHSTSSLLMPLRILGHTSNSLLRGTVDTNHSTSSFLVDLTIRGTAALHVGIVNFDAYGVSSGINDGSNDIHSPNGSVCMNKRIMSKYGWEPTSTPIQTFNKCNIKR